MSDDLIDEALQACLDSIEARSPVRLERPAVHPGIFEPKELARIAVLSPTVLLAAAGFDQDPEAGDGDTYDYAAELAANIIVRDSGDATRHQLAHRLVQYCLGRIPGQLWGGDPWIEPPGPILADNMYSAANDSVGVAWWAIRWQQTLRLPRIR